MDLKNHPGMWLRDDAAAAFNAMEDKYGAIIVNSAGRTVREQQELIDAWDRGERDGLYAPARPASESNHVRGGGIAVDVYNYTDDRPKLNEFGFQWYGSADPVHYTFTGWGGGTSAPISESNPFGIAFCAGLQKIANLYGGGTEIDQIWGPRSAAGFARFLRANWGYADADDDLGPNMWRAIQRWLATRWGYSGDIDGIPGPLTRASLQAAETANFNEL